MLIMASSPMMAKGEEDEMGCELVSECTQDRILQILRCGASIDCTVRLVCF